MTISISDNLRFVSKRDKPFRVGLWGWASTRRNSVDWSCPWLLEVAFLRCWCTLGVSANANIQKISLELPQMENCQFLSYYQLFSLSRFVLVTTIWLFYLSSLKGTNVKLVLAYSICKNLWSSAGGGGGGGGGGPCSEWHGKPKKCI